MSESVDAYVIGRGLARLRRSTALLLVTAAYLVATAVGVGIGIAASVAGWHPLLAALVGDLTGTVVVL